MTELPGSAAGAGGSATATAIGTGTGTAAGRSSVTVNANATGQTGGTNFGSIEGTGQAGTGGNATAAATGTGGGIDGLFVYSTAIGGNGGVNFDGSQFGGTGGNAVATALGNGSAGTIVTVTSVATGGTGGYVPATSAVTGTMGNATASATANGAGIGGFSSASANAAGVTGTSTSVASFTNSGLVSMVRGTAIGPVDVQGLTTAQATIGQSLSTLNPATSGIGGASISIGMPVAGDVTTAWAGATNTPAAFNNAAANVLGLETTALTNLPGASGTTAHTSTAILELAETNGLIGATGLVAGSVSPMLSGTGLAGGTDSLQFQLQRNGVTLINQTFTSNAAVTSYFTDTVFDLGIAGADLSGANLDLQFVFTLRSSTAGNGFEPTLLIGNVPAAQARGAYQTGTFTTAAGGSLALPNNWARNTLVNGPGTTGIFGSSSATARTLTLDENQELGSLQFGGAANFTLASGSGGVLTVDNAGATAVISSGAQTVNFTAPVVLVSPGVTVTTSPAGSVVLTGGVSGPGGITLAAGAFTLGGTNSYTGPTTVNGGVFTLAAVTTGGFSVDKVNALSVTAPGVLYVQGAANPTNRTLVVASIVLSTGTIDLANNELDVTSSSLSAITALVASGYNLSGGGQWNGPGIVSSTAAANPSHLTALGLIQNNQSGSPIFFAGHTFDGTVPGVADVLVRYTYFGDANLDGRVDGSDYTLIDAGFASHGALTGWFNGDFNYDGAVDGSDYALIDNAYNNQGSPLATPSALTATATAQAAPAAVPEPASIALTACIAAAFLGRPRRVKKRSIRTAHGASFLTSP